MWPCSFTVALGAGLIDQPDRALIRSDSERLGLGGGELVVGNQPLGMHVGEAFEFNAERVRAGRSSRGLRRGRRRWCRGRGRMSRLVGRLLLRLASMPLRYAVRDGGNGARDGSGQLNRTDGAVVVSENEQKIDHSHQPAGDEIAQCGTDLAVELIAGRAGGAAAASGRDRSTTVLRHAHHMRGGTLSG